MTGPGRSPTTHGDLANGQLAASNDVKALAVCSWRIPRPAGVGRLGHEAMDGDGLIELGLEGGGDYLAIPKVFTHSRSGSAAPSFPVGWRVTCEMAGQVFDVGLPAAP